MRTVLLVFVIGMGFEDMVATLVGKDWAAAIPIGLFVTWAIWEWRATFKIVRREPAP